MRQSPGRRCAPPPFGLPSSHAVLSFFRMTRRSTLRKRLCRMLPRNGYQLSSGEIMMPRFGALLLVCLFAPCAVSQVVTGHGIDVADLDRKTDPCLDLAQFANGTWHAHNPIPASMTRWSRRWQAGENAKDRLKDILEGLPKENPKGSTEQIISDYYGACMDQSRVNARGVEPLKPWFARIDGAKDV